jgi:hypothetical protein
MGQNKYYVLGQDNTLRSCFVTNGAGMGQRKGGLNLSTVIPLGVKNPKPTDDNK